MKHKESVTQVYIRRDTVVLPYLIRQAKLLATCPVSAKKVYQIAAELPVDRFYIGDDAACNYIRKRIYYGETPQFISPYKQKLFDALYDEVMKMRDTERYGEMSLKDVTILALSHKAPCVGLTPYIIGVRERRQKRRHKHK